MSASVEQPAIQGKALVVEQINGPFHLVTLRQESSILGDDEVLVRFLTSGICHTDLGSWSGAIPCRFPCVLGHEGAGIVEAVGKDLIDYFAKGDTVAATFCSCGRCGSCHDDEPACCVAFMQLNFGCINSSFQPAEAIYERDGQSQRAAVKYFGQSSFGNLMPVTGRSLVRVPSSVPPHLISALACGFQTGFSTVLEKISCQTHKARSYDNFAALPTKIKADTQLPTLQSRTSAGRARAKQAKEGHKGRAVQTLLVSGIGAVGLGAVMAGKMMGYGQVIACDINEHRLSIAKKAGATNVINVAGLQMEEIVGQVKDFSSDGLGATLSVEASGAPNALKSAVLSLATRGKAVIVGSPPPTALLDIPSGDILANAWTIEGVLMGNSEPSVTIPFLCKLVQNGELELLKEIVRVYKPEQMQQAVKDALDGTVIKAVIDWT